MTNQVLPRSCRGLARNEGQPDRFGAWHKRPYNAFTLIELIVVVGIITILAGLVLSTVGYARKKGARARAETEIAAISAACENYKADLGVYPRPTQHTNTLNTLNARQNFDATQNVYQNGQSLSVQRIDWCILSGNRTPTPGARVLFGFQAEYAICRPVEAAKLLQLSRTLLVTAMVIPPANPAANPVTTPRAIIPHSIFGARLVARLLLTP